MTYTNNYIRGLRLAEISNGTATRQYTFNAHGDVTGLVDTTTGAVTDYTYDAYGNEDNASATDTNPFRYSGEYYDAETGFIYLRARYYDPSIGRFTAEDTHWTSENMVFGDREYEPNEIKIPSIEAIKQSANLYAYCMNNPMQYVDPSGDEGVAVTMLYHAFFGKGKYQDYSNNKMFLSTFISSDVLKNKIDEKLVEFKKTGLSTNTIDGNDLALYGNENLNDYDLSFAVGKANYTMTFNKIEKTNKFLFWSWEETKYDVTVTIMDRYNFDEYRDSKSLGAILNNWGYDKQKAGQIKPFDWAITFTMKGLK